MDYIRIGIYSEHKLLQEGICSLIEKVEGLQICLQENTIGKLLKTIRLSQINILILHPVALDLSVMTLLEQLRNKYPRIQVLILSAVENEVNILKTIKAGAKGFLAKESDRNDLLEAIYTLRGGHDYYSKSITQLLLKKYINDIKSNDTHFDNQDVKCLSSRELEILKLWGNSYTNNEISEELFISVRTVESHKNHIMQKLNMKTAVDLVKFAIRNNIIEV
ncbi:MAG: response regulator transcription factor [Spirochaetaceae bacterium]